MSAAASRTSPLQSARRLEWVDGSALTWRDLRDGVAAEEAMLALHMRALHDTWGVALGLTTLLGADQRSVLVTPGFAITCLGMSILLPSAQVIEGPPAINISVSSWDLVLQAPTLGEGDPCYRATMCDLEVPPRLASVHWHRVDEPLDQRTSVVLARFVRLPTGLLAGPNLEVRRGTRVLERPHVASGIIVAGGVTWTTSGPRLLASIDTSEAGFSRAPIYRVWVAARSHWPTNVIGAFLSVVSATRLAVNLQLLVPGASLATARTIAQDLSLGWLGVEPMRGCPPGFTLTHIVAAHAGVIDPSLWAATLAAVPGFQP